MYFLLKMVIFQYYHASFQGCNPHKNRGPCRSRCIFVPEVRVFEGPKNGTQVRSEKSGNFTAKKKGQRSSPNE